MTATASKFLLRPVLVPPAPEVLAETDALVLLVSATDGAACHVHEVAPLAAHLAGPMSAVAPDWLEANRREFRDLDRLLLDACGTVDVTCTCDGTSEHPLHVVLPALAPVVVVRPHRNDATDQAAFEEAIYSGDVDLLTYAADARLDALKMLADRARAVEGGDLPDLVAEAVVTLARTLVGPSRWQVLVGYTKWDWPVGWRPGIVEERAHRFLLNENVYNAVVTRLIEGR